MTLRRCLRHPRFVALALALIASSPVTVRATGYTWDGGLALGATADGNWSTANNWTGGVAPVSAADTDLVFAGVAGRTGSNNNVSDPLTLRTLTFQAGNTHYFLSGGALNVLGGIVQNSSFIQSVANVVNVTASQTWSAGAGAGGLNLNGGLNIVNGAALGLNAGTVNVANSMVTVSGATTATLNLGGSAALFANTMWVGSANGGGGVVQSGGSLTVSGYLSVASKAASSYTLTGGTLSTGEFQVGYNAAGTITHSGGSFTTNGNALYLGYDVSGSGSYTLGGAGSTVSAGSVYLGNTNGTTGTVVVNNGTLTVGSGKSLYVGYHGVGDFTQNGGMVDVSAGNVLSVGEYGDGSGIYRLNGGVLRANAVQGGSSQSSVSTFDFNGGTLRASSSGGYLVFGLKRAYVQAGGAVFDTAGFNANVPQLLQHDPALGGAPDGGLSKLGAGTLILSAANTYNGGTRVSGGTLRASANGALGMGSVTLQNAALTLDAGVTNAIADTAVLTLSGTASVNLLGGAGSVQENVYALAIDGAFQKAGSYGASGSGAQYVDNTHFTGTGVLYVAAVPEPGSAALLAGFGGLLAVWRACRGRLRRGEFAC